MSYIASWVDPFLRDVSERRLAGESASRPETKVLPVTDVLERPEAWVLLSDMPGVEPAGVEVSVNEGVLHLTGRRSTSAEAGAGIVEAERTKGAFHRSFKLDLTKVDVAAISATIKNGVLRVCVPKSGPARVHRIQVKSE
ncbi:MAG: Hsp20/alpha crystallin family protein [Elusimicrobia bacterium]|jgi:HSP20 family protein|nr:Hsp20/alpha crystallin family protein [Elusimicrobiota bacterium]